MTHRDYEKPAEVQTINAFLDWLDRSNIVLAQWSDTYALCHVSKFRQQLLAEYLQTTAEKRGDGTGLDGSPSAI